jgi:hypothetical protein
MLIRVRPPGYQVSLWLFLRNSQLATVRRVGRDAVQAVDADPARLKEAVALWKGLNELADVELLPDP